MNKKSLVFVLLVFITINSLFYFIHKYQDEKPLKNNLNFNSFDKISLFINNIHYLQAFKLSDNDSFLNEFNKNYKIKIIGLFDLNSCPSCIKEKLNILSDLYNKYNKNKGNIFVSAIVGHDNLRELKIFKLNENILFPIYLTRKEIFKNKYSIDVSDFPMIIICDEDNKLISATSVYGNIKLIGKYINWLNNLIKTQ